jgi:hypothetical protein
MPQLGHGLGLYLPDSLASHTELFTDLVECLLNAIAQTKARLNYASFSWVKRLEDSLQLSLKHCESNRIGRNDSFGIFD